MSDCALQHKYPASTMQYLVAQCKIKRKIKWKVSNSFSVVFGTLSSQCKPREPLNIWPVVVAIRRYVNSCWATVVPNKVFRTADKVSQTSLERMGAVIFATKIRAVMAMVLAELGTKQRTFILKQPTKAHFLMAPSVDRNLEIQ